MSAAKVLILSRDLMFLSRVTGSAKALGLTTQALGSIAQALDAGLASPDLVLLDLSDLQPSPGSIRQLRDAMGQQGRLLAFGSHVNVQELESAARAGCDQVMARSRFVAELSSILGAVSSKAADNLGDPSIVRGL